MFIEAKDDGNGGDNWATGAIGRAKLQSNHHHQQTNTQFLYRPDALHVTQPTVSEHWREISHSCLPQAHLGVFQLCLWPLIAPGYLGGGLLCLSSALWCQYSRGVRNTKIYITVNVKCKSKREAYRNSTFWRKCSLSRTKQIPLFSGKSVKGIRNIPGASKK